MIEQNFLGVGWRFPVKVDTDAQQQTRIALSEYESLIEESILLIISTTKGERLMRPTYGCDLKRLVFAPNNTSTAGLAIFYVKQALTKWEPRIELLNVDANADTEKESVLVISILFKVIATNNELNLVYPFYLGGQ